MSKARQLADLLSSTGDVVIGALDNAPAPNPDWNTLTNKPSGLGDASHSSTVDTTNASNITSGYFNPSRLANGSPSGSYSYRGDHQWATNCSNYPNCGACNVSNCQCACACNC